MRLRNKSLSFVINFLLGVAWAFVLLGSITSFLSFYQYNIFYALISAVVGAIPGLIGIVILEHIITTQENNLELKKQTKLLEKIYEHK
ncbi:MAG: hypothetical protein DSZ12_05280 [Sulfurovum sp.]|nr:MAG: hypothetical protein DSZ08_03580 [Sulfurovum sp.]RUM74582.1 MAG: hypothetical protein DSZ12_05280 [Sulfurovum sp.]